MEQGIKFRKGTMDDLDRLAAINGSGITEEVREAKEKLPEFINVGHLACALINEEMVGLFYWKDNFLGLNNWYLTQITVDIEKRKQGIGEAIWRHFLSKAKEHGIEKVFCDITMANKISTHLAEKIGGKQVGNIDLGDDDSRYFYRFDL